METEPHLEADKQADINKQLDTGRHRVQQEQEVGQSSKKLDLKLILQLLGSPLDSLKLGGQHFIYGLLGLSVSAAAFWIWAIAMGKQVVSFFNPLMRLGSLFGGIPRSFIMEVYGKLIVFGLWSTASLLVVVWLAGWWRSGKQTDWKSFIAKVGGAHYIGGAGFLLAAIFSFSFSLSVLLFAITLLLLLVFTLYAGAEASEVPREKMSLYLTVSVVGVVLLLSLWGQILF